MIKKSLGLYLHIPFCAAKCAYCDFYSLSGANEECMIRYTDALRLQLEDYAAAAKAYHVDTVFIGGGTPTTLPVKCMCDLIDTIYRNYDVDKNAEFTMECNPATVSMQALKKYRHAGINRLSIGLQSADPDELTALSRIHSRSDFETTFLAARKAGFDNINIDIMYAIPMQTPESWSKTLEYVTSFEPEHISMYGLKIEEGTRFYKIRDSLILPDEDTEADMYFNGITYLEARGYRHYEISNFAKPGYECKHNLRYWNCDEYLGLGCAAHSYFQNTRFSFKRNIDLFMDAMEADITHGRLMDGNTLSYDEYRNAELIDELYTIPANERIGEYIMLRLRLSDGISSAEFERRFGLNFDAIYGRRLKVYIDNGFMSYNGESYALTAKGMFVSNYILSNLLDFDENSHMIASIADGSDR